MPLFTSTRERRLWTWTLVVVVTIYSTLGLARRLSDTLRDRELSESAFILGFLMLGVAIVIQALRTKASIAEIGIVLGVAGVYIMLFSRMASPEERTHLFEYGLVAVLIFQALTERRRHGRRVPVPAAVAVVATALLGWLDEGVQFLLPERVYDIRDVGFNAIAGLVAVLATLALAWARRRVRFRNV